VTGRYSNQLNYRSEFWGANPNGLIDKATSAFTPAARQAAPHGDRLESRHAVNRSVRAALNFLRNVNTFSRQPATVAHAGAPSAQCIEWTLRILRMKLNGISLSCAALVLLGASPVFAALGGALDSVQADQVHIKGALRVTSNSGFTVHEISTAFGTSVREYTGPRGTVFAVAWDGPVNPDFEHLFGSYYTDYLQAAAAAAAHGSHRHLSIQLADLVIQNNGRMRAFAGRAWVPSLLPQNVSADDIR
jgi:hypothetical protein